MSTENGSTSRLGRALLLAACKRFDDVGYMTGSKRILAIESSGRHASVATLWGDSSGTRLVEQTLLSGDERTARVLAPTIQQLLAAAEWSPKSVELVAITVGPGSFTGLRIGVTTAKAFAYAIGADVMGVNTLEALALQAPRSATPLWAVLEAQRQELFAAKFIVNEQLSILTEHETCIIPQDAWLASLRPGDRVIGPALSRLESRLPAGIEAVPEQLWQPTATSVGQVAWRKYQAGGHDDVWKLSPNYYRPSAAEEKQIK
jgi:tRNA threonylcarbamoyladenosine biosynthesis protein TsaB